MKMLFSLFVIAHQAYGVIPTCKSEITNYTVCIPEDFNNDYPDGQAIVETIINIYDFVEVNWVENTISLFIQLTASWHDTRVKLKNE